MRPGFLLLSFSSVALCVTLASAGATTLTMENVISNAAGDDGAQSGGPFFGEDGK